MNLNQLEYFVAVAENLNFTKAAQKCYISQTAMTQQIRSLEKTVGVQLFVRDKHHVELTAAGKVYLTEAKAILQRSNEALRLVRTVSEGMAGELSIGYIRGYGQSYLAEPLRSFHEKYPNIELSFMRNNMSVLLEQVEKGACDLAFTITPAERPYDPLRHFSLEEFPVMAVLSQSHPLANKPYLTYSELEEEEFIMMQPTDRPKDQMEESLLIYKRGGFLPKVVGIEGDPETLLLMISVGMGISILPEYIIQPFYRKKDLAILPMVRDDRSAETVEFGVHWRSENVNPAIEQLIDLLKAGREKG